MGKANPNYFPGEKGGSADVGNSILDDYRNQKAKTPFETEKTEQTVEKEKCPVCQNSVPKMKQLYNEGLERYLHVGCFAKEVSEE